MKSMETHPKTADINKNQKNASKKLRQEALAWLTKTFPKAFNTDSKVQPLKIGIIDDIFSQKETLNIPFSKAKLREALVVFTRRMDYLASLKTRNMRVDLEGNPVTQVTEEEAENAANKIKLSIERSIQQRRSSSDSSYPRPSAAKTPALIKLKKRSPKSFDPTAIARLKEKLGIKKEETEVS